MTTPEALARQKIDELLRAAVWVVRNRVQLNLGAGRGVAVPGAVIRMSFITRRME